MQATQITHAPRWPVDADRPTLPPSACHATTLRPLAMPPQFAGDDRVTVRPMPLKEGTTMEHETNGSTTMRVERVYDDANTYCGCVIHAVDVLGGRWAWTACAIDGADVRNVHGRSESRLDAIAAVIREAHALTRAA